MADRIDPSSRARFPKFKAEAYGVANQRYNSATPMSLTAGTILGQYEIRSPLGAGGMGEVYRAHDTRLDRDVAIKVLPEYLTSDSERLRRFEQEARATAALNHPNILAVHQMATDRSISYLVEELLDGETLRERLRHGPVPTRKAIDYGVQIAHGLAAAHDRGIVHRDLKPENLFVTKDGRVKILDFGLAKVNRTPVASADGKTVTLGEQTDPGLVLGTVGYMSPEQVRGQNADHRSDIFAFGAILYEMVTGRPAFRKPTKTETMTAILNEDPPSLSQISTSTPPGLQRIVHRCLEKNAEQRFHSAHDLAFALEALSDSGSSMAMAARQESQSRWKWIAVAAAVVALVAGLITWWKVPPAIPAVDSVKQLTDDGEAKNGGIHSDGSRIYFNEGETMSWKIAQVSVNGGPTAMLDANLADPLIFALARDGSELLVSPGGMDLTISPLWSIPLPAGEPRQLGNIMAQWADLFPDGHIVFSTGKELYVADKDGSNPRKLFSGSGGATGAWNPAVSPDGGRIAFATQIDGSSALAEIAPDGTDFRILVRGATGARWSPDGKYLVYRVRHGNESDLWAQPMHTGIFRRSREPIQLTSGPLAYTGAMPAPNGKEIFAIGTKRRGELVRYDMKSGQFVPFLSGISAIDPTFSQDGRWVAYVSYPDHTLWRSRSDGSERKQLTYPPMEVIWPRISPDGTKVAFTTSNWATYVISMDGGSPQRIVEKDSSGSSWSPDGNLVAIGISVNSPSGADKWSQQVFDIRTGKMSELPASTSLGGGQWITTDTLIAVTQDQKEFRVFDFKTHQWSHLASGNFVNWNISPDRKYFYFTTGGSDPKAQRLRIADRQIETLVSLKDFRRVVDSVEAVTQISVAPDGSPVFTRNIGSQEIYALTVKWP